MEIPSLSELKVSKLGECNFRSPLPIEKEGFIDDSRRVVVSDESDDLERILASGEPIPTFEMAGPREKVFFDPHSVCAGIVTCGGICPGLNDVIRSITLTLLEGYKARRVIGFRYGYAGLTRDTPFEPFELTSSSVKAIHESAGTILGSSRGPQDMGEMADTIDRYRINILFAVGGDGTLTGASELAQELGRRGRPVAVIGVPKTIDNDLNWILQSFGFSTAVEEAARVIRAAHVEARAALNGVGLVKLMGRHSGFIAVHATLATTTANFCLIPEVPFLMEGEGGLLRAIEERLDRKHHAVVVVAEGAGQHLMIDGQKHERDASGNIKLKDSGLFLKQQFEAHFKSVKKPMIVRYFDPSYSIRSAQANPEDAQFCLRLGQYAAHAGMAGRTDMVVGIWCRRFTHVPISVVTGVRKQIDPAGLTWQAVLSTTHQPGLMI